MGIAGVAAQYSSRAQTWFRRIRLRRRRFGHNRTAGKAGITVRSGVSPENSGLSIRVRNFALPWVDAWAGSHKNCPDTPGLASPTIPGKPSIVGITGPIHDQSAHRTFRPGRLSPIGELTLENDRVTLFSLLPMLGSMLLKSLPS